MVLTEKETMFIDDLKKQEELCIKKYNLSAEKACDEQLRQLFKKLETEEQRHLEVLDEILHGNVPSVPQSKKAASETFEKSRCSKSAQDSDKFLCEDALSTEKYAASSYNTGIFEFKNENVRMMLNHIETEEQNHGKEIYDYMAANGMY